MTYHGLTFDQITELELRYDGPIPEESIDYYRRANRNLANTLRIKLDAASDEAEMYKYAFRAYARSHKFAKAENMRELAEQFRDDAIDAFLIFRKTRKEIKRISDQLSRLGV